jgi:hypothetical protein
MKNYKLVGFSGLLLNFSGLSLGFSGYWFFHFKFSKKLNQTDWFSVNRQNCSRPGLPVFTKTDHFSLIFQSMALEPGPQETTAFNVR